MAYQIRDIINAEWAERTDVLAGYSYTQPDLIKGFTNDQLAFSIYWNFGISGADTHRLAKLALSELNTRGVEYNNEWGQAVNTLVEKVI